MLSTQSNDSLRELNAKLLAEICELRKKVAEDEVEKTKLRQELKARTDKNIPVITTSQENNDDDIEFTKSQVIEQELTKGLLSGIISAIFLCRSEGNQDNA
ncbi:hypothetical protein RhiirA4_471740 [Rhizophagus irregularis]|uniref:Uncharacterized protein n=1 Tax=Rhizophagus irregularis TaxID=588596 RepID=A0A2I1GZA3_9GLOM|nr:hypothetical protein RhiirA4_469294 [Rhizophagus irregularis]PKY53495.1 hypothetical protein RhiirA4_471740 [Rhizophagus irregularis]